MVLTKGKKILIWVSIILLLIAAIVSQIFHIQNMKEMKIKQDTIPSPTELFYVNDFANILSDETKEIILGANNMFSTTEEKPQIVVSCVDSLNGNSVENYANKMFNQYGIGNKDYDNGVLVLISTQEREIRIEVGYGLEGIITDAKAGSILDANIELLKDDEFDLALRNIFKSVATMVCYEYGYDGSDYTIDKEYLQDIVGGQESNWFILLYIMMYYIGFDLLFCVFDIIYYGFFPEKLPKVMQDLDGKNITIRQIRRKSLKTIRSSRRRRRSGSGGRGFSGGGGRSGGGGASRRF